VTIAANVLTSTASGFHYSRSDLQKCTLLPDKVQSELQVCTEDSYPTATAFPFELDSSMASTT